jgi:2-oxoglutarate/2-oxoacid ferredoxin oxidoreductase subunit alpha
MARADGLSVGALYPRVLGPFPTQRVEAFAGGARVVVVPEVNHTGQLARLVRAECGLRVAGHAKCDGLPFTAEDIHDIILQEAAS